MMTCIFVWLALTTWLTQPSLVTICDVRTEAVPCIGSGSSVQPIVCYGNVKHNCRTFCSVCLYEGHRSTLQQGICTSTLAAATSSYDSDGRYHYNDPNVTTCTWQCSRGHVMTEHYQAGTPKQ